MRETISEFDPNSIIVVLIMSQTEAWNVVNAHALVNTAICQKGCSKLQTKLKKMTAILLSNTWWLQRYLCSGRARVMAISKNLHRKYRTRRKTHWPDWNIFAKFWVGFVLHLSKSMVMNITIQEITVYLYFTTNKQTA